MQNFRKYFKRGYPVKDVLSKNKNLLLQILKFGVVGGLAFLIDFGLLFVLTEFVHIHYFLSACISFSVSVIFNYIASIVWVFDVDKSKDKKSVFAIFIILSIAGLLINQLCMWLGVDIIHLHYMLVKIFATGIVMVFNFITRKKFME